MNDDRCPRADEIGRAARRGVVDRDVERHLESCPECADEALVSAFFVEIEERQTAPTQLPDATAIWRRAARARRIDASRRATRIIAVWKWVSIACGVALALAGAIRYSGLVIDRLPRIELELGTVGPATIGVGSGAAMIAVAGMLGVLVLIDRFVLAEY
jgi:hypothetical protein